MVGNLIQVVNRLCLNYDSDSPRGIKSPNVCNISNWKLSPRARKKGEFWRPEIKNKTENNTTVKEGSG